MRKYGIDFGTGNTVIAYYLEAMNECRTLEIPGITVPMNYRLPGSTQSQVAHVTPSIIHYGENEVLIGNEVMARGLASHPHTLRWMKRGLMQGKATFRSTPAGPKSAQQAAGDFLARLLQVTARAGADFSLHEGTFTFTAPVEAFDHFHDWLHRVAESLGIREFRILDEPTAAVLGYEVRPDQEESYLVFDFGCGTLDVQVIGIDADPQEHKKAVEKGKAGIDLGGMDIDKWIAEDFHRRHAFGLEEARSYEGMILLHAEAVKIELSDCEVTESVLTIPMERGGDLSFARTIYARSCASCERGHSARQQPESGKGCLGCLLLQHHFLKAVRETVERALENAAMKGVRRDHIRQVVVTGGMGLMPCVRTLLDEMFPALESSPNVPRVVWTRPFDAVGLGACRGKVWAILPHVYGLRSYDKNRGETGFMALFESGTQYPTREQITCWAQGTYDGMSRIRLTVIERARVRRPQSLESLVDARGNLLPSGPVVMETVDRELNGESPTYLNADPPIIPDRDEKRFFCTFRVDEYRRLRVTIVDHRAARKLLDDHPVVRL